jgi:ATP-dependent Clp protease ATP-binding subunit ClpA
MRRAVERFLEDPLAEEILKGTLIDGEPVKVSAADGKLTFNQSTPASGALTGEGA